MSTTNWNWLKVGLLVCMSPLGLLCLPTLVSFSIIHMHCCFCFSFYLLWASLHHSHFHYLMLMFLYLNECLILIICCLAAVLFVDCDCEIRDCRFLHWTAETVFLDVVSLKIRCQLWSRSVSPVAMIWTSVSLWAGWCDHWIHKQASFVTMRSWFLIIYVSWWWVILVTCL